MFSFRNKNASVAAEEPTRWIPASQVKAGDKMRHGERFILVASSKKCSDHGPKYPWVVIEFDLSDIPKGCFVETPYKTPANAMVFVEVATAKESTS